MLASGRVSILNICKESGLAKFIAEVCQHILIDTLSDFYPSELLNDFRRNDCVLNLDRFQRCRRYLSEHGCADEEHGQNGFHLFILSIVPYLADDLLC